MATMWVRILPLVILLASCSRPDASASKSEQPKSEQTKPEQPKTGEAAKPVSSAPAGCVRGEPEQLLKSNSDFQKTAPGEAIETVHIDGPFDLSIHHYGCAHYALEFEFKWHEAVMPAPTVSLETASDFIEKLPVEEANIQVFKLLAAAMKKMAKNPYQQPMVMSETENLTATTPSRNTLKVKYDVAL